MNTKQELEMSQGYNLSEPTSLAHILQQSRVVFPNTATKEDELSQDTLIQTTTTPKSKWVSEN